jgi:chromate transport protein ChrA
MNFIIPFFVVMSIVGKSHGDAQMGYIIVGVWGIICSIVYTFYFAIPEFNKNWEKIVGLLLPTIILSLILFQESNFGLIIILNFVMNVFFIWHLKKKTFTNSRL